MYLPARYGVSPPELPDDILSITLVDFSYKRDVLLALKAKYPGKDITVIDHHKTAQEDLGDLDWTIFDMEKSGAVLAWEYWYPHTLIPPLLLHIQDRDLWKFEIGGTKEVSAALRSYPQDFAVWSELSERCGDLPYEGRHILRYINQQASLLADRFRIIDVGGFMVPAINTSFLVSEVCEELNRRWPGYQFAVCYHDRPDGKREYSLRSGEWGFDVSVVASSMGGGGHRAAAGFIVDW